jgi:hypothetical protein
MSYNVLSCRELVKDILISFPESRDSDEKLVARIWHWQIKSKNLKEPVLKLLYDGQLIPVKSIERCRRDLQSKLPELRGTKYKIRKTTLEQQTRKIFSNGKS